MIIRLKNSFHLEVWRGCTFGAGLSAIHKIASSLEDNIDGLFVMNYFISNGILESKKLLTVLTRLELSHSRRTGSNIGATPRRISNS